MEGLHNSLNLFDIAVAFLILISALLGFFSGLISSLLSTSGWVLSIMITCYAFPYIEPILGHQSKSRFIVFTIGYGALLLGSLIAFAIINAIIRSVLSKIAKGTLDRVLGGLFGVIKTLILVTLGLAFFLKITAHFTSKTAEPMPEIVKDSYSYAVIGPLLHSILPYIEGEEELG